MKVSHVVTALLVSIVAVLAVLLTTGSYSSTAYQDLLEQKTRIQDNLLQLQQKKADLQAEIELLQRSADAVRLAARDLGYFEASEVVVRSPGSGPDASSRSPGRIVTVALPEAPAARLSILSAVSAFVIALLALVVSRPYESRRDSR